MSSGILVFAEQRSGVLKRSGLEALSQARRMASDGMGPVTVAVVGSDIAAAAGQVAAAGAARVLAFDHPELALYAPAAYASALAEAVRPVDPAAVLLPASSMGRTWRRGSRPAWGIRWCRMSWSSAAPPGG